MKKLMKALIATGLGIGLVYASGCLANMDKWLCAANPDSSACDDGIWIGVPDDIGDLF